MKQLFFAAASFFAVSFVMAQGQTLSFESAWKKINEASAAQDSAKLQTESLSESSARASRHWLPKVYLDAKSYQTNDPGSSFFGLLEQRSLSQADFDPDKINHPDTKIYSRGALGLDLALYEGGMKSSQVGLFKHTLEAQKNATSQIQMEQYSLVGMAYGSIAVLEQQKARLQDLSALVSRMIKSYQLGSRSNPVGYSGLLGMKSLSNRISGLINQNQAQSQSYYGTLKELGLRRTDWIAENRDANTFVNRYFSVSSQAGEDSSASYKIESAKENAKASLEMAQMEKARFLPRIGAFAESFMFTGARDTANGYSAGLYLQWNLFDPTDFGRHKEAKLKSMAAVKYSEALEQQERAERHALKEQLLSLRQNIDLLSDSHKLLVEQAKVTENLFKNGSINALQMVEILSRRADLISQEGEAELGLIKIGAEIVTKQKSDVDQLLKPGAKNEKQ